MEYDGISMGLEYLKPETKRTLIMLKICLYKQKIENTEKPDETSIVIKEEPTPKNPPRILNRVRSYYDHFISSEYGLKGTIHAVRTSDFRNLAIIIQITSDTKQTDQKSWVIFKNYLKMFRKFTAKRNVIREGIG